VALASPVAQVVMEGDRAAGIELKSGRVIRARCTGSGFTVEDLGFRV
jgi:hypothetical protein